MYIFSGEAHGQVVDDVPCLDTLALQDQWVIELDEQNPALVVPRLTSRIPSEHADYVYATLLTGEDDWELIRNHAEQYFHGIVLERHRFLHRRQNHQISFPFPEILLRLHPIALNLKEPLLYLHQAARYHKQFFLLQLQLLK